MTGRVAVIIAGILSALVCCIGVGGITTARLHPTTSQYQRPTDGPRTQHPREHPQHRRVHRRRRVPVQPSPIPSRHHVGRRPTRRPRLPADGEEPQQHVGVHRLQHDHLTDQPTANANRSKPQAGTVCGE